MIKFQPLSNQRNTNKITGGLELIQRYVFSCLFKYFFASHAKCCFKMLFNKYTVNHNQEI